MAASFGHVADQSERSLSTPGWMGRSRLSMPRNSSSRRPGGTRTTSAIGVPGDFGPQAFGDRERQLRDLGSADVARARQADSELLGHPSGSAGQDDDSVAQADG